MIHLREVYLQLKEALEKEFGGRVYLKKEIGNKPHIDGGKGTVGALIEAA